MPVKSNQSYKDFFVKLNIVVIRVDLQINGSSCTVKYIFLSIFGLPLQKYSIATVVTPWSAFASQLDVLFNFFMLWAWSYQVSYPVCGQVLVPFQGQKLINSKVLVNLL